MLSRFNPIPERNRRTDRFAVSISRVSMLTRDKMNSDSIPSNWPSKYFFYCIKHLCHGTIIRMNRDPAWTGMKYLSVRVKVLCFCTEQMDGQTEKRSQ